ncbi:YhgE/Pip domain-containing protein [Alicyclobacillus acidiphilus]|uniref:YhgE/Pip domain-containing protein n=1 Tax=Alicyclobacillus acidiphilus TaxID=182455 RepID=UPI00082CBF90|nr:YhgE/Pip domain-containing protein [Alicyclobacillus acidiphilus]
MNGLATVRSELRYNLGHVKRLIPILAIMFIPVMYAGTFLWAFWNPYGHLDRLPVAVVNEDRGATFDGKSIHAGSDLEQNLKTNHNLGWQFVNQAQANKGFADHQYYMVITIPPNFSKEAAAAATEPGAPQPKLLSKTNDRYNYIAGIIGRNAMVKVQEQTANALAKTYAANLVSGLIQLETGYHAAQRGASQVASGAQTLAEQNANLVHGVQAVTSGTTSLANAATSAKAGADRLASGIQSAQQATQKLSGGIGQLSQAAGQLAQSTGTLATGAGQLHQGLASATTGAEQVSSGAKSLAAGLAAMEQQNPQLANSPQFQQLVAASQQVAAGAAKVAAADSTLTSGAGSLSSGAQKLQQGLAVFASDAGKLQQGAQTVATSEQQLVAGAQSLQSGLARLAAGGSKLENGAKSLENGITAYTGGASKVASGAQRLASKMASANKQIPAVHSSQVVSAISHPVGLSQQTTGGIANYGNGFAPYFLSLGLYVGTLLMSIVIQFRDPAERPSSGVAWFVSKAVLLGGVAVVQSLIADAVLLYGLGVHTHNVAEFVLFSVLSSLTFVSIIQFFVSTLQNPGRFIAVIIMILQLTTSSGTYPVVLSPKFFQNLAPYFPMHYTVDGFRYLIGGGSSSFMVSDVWHMIGYWLAFLILTFGFFVWYHRRTYPSNVEPSAPGLQA